MVLMNATLTVLTVAVLGLGFIFVPSAQAAVQSNVFIPLNDINFVPCLNNGRGDTIQLTGVVHILNLVTLDNSGGFLLHTTINDQDLTAVSLTTGVKYNGGSGDSFTLNGKVGVEQTFSNTFILVSQGTGAKVLFKGVGHLTVNPDGTVTVMFNTFNVQCT